MDYAQTLEYLYYKLPMFSRVGSVAFKKDLTNTLRLCERLGNPQKQFRSVHVAGTNGKGSVSHMLAAVFQSTGHKTGLYTSPHLYDFRERIRCNGEMVPEAFVVEFTEQLKPLIEEIEPSFFEITVAMAFRFFAEQKVDVAVVEVGLGGRIDSTNVILPELSVITNIGWDHMNMLGNSLEAIAGEKAGIVKPGVPVVIGETLPQTKPVFEKAAQAVEAPLCFAETFYRPENHQLSGNYLEVAYEDRNGKTVTLTSDLPGIYQVKNLRTVLAAVDVLRTLGWRLPQSDVAAALANVKGTTGLHGRWEVIHPKPRVVLEVAHNKEGIEEMLRHIGSLSYGRLHLVFGTVKDKDPGPVLSLLPPDARYYFTQADIPRALPAADLQAKANVHHLTGEVYPDVNLAVKAALAAAAEDDLIVVCGSIFLVAEVNRETIPVSA